MEATNQHRLGEDDRPLSLDSIAEFRDTALSMVRQASRSVRIFTRDLDHAAYDNPPFVEAVLDLVKRSRIARVEILVQDSLRAVKEGHRLVDASQRFSSKMEIRNPHSDYRDYNQAFLVVDGTGFLRRPLADRYATVGSFRDRLAAQELERFFSEVWERSEADPQLRRLHL